jgi:hypothetical protein
MRLQSRLNPNNDTTRDHLHVPHISYLTGLEIPSNGFPKVKLNDRKPGMYSLKEAADAVGRGKPAILKAIQKGIISAQKNPLGQWEIDPSELHRVYKLVSREAIPESEFERQEPSETVNDSIELRAKLGAMAELKARIENECADLRRRLDQSEEARLKAEEAKDKAFAELTRLTLMLTDQRERQQGAVTREKKGFWSRLFS